MSNWHIQSEKKLIFFWREGILDTDVSRYCPKETSKERFLGEIDLQVFPHFLCNQCPMNLLASHILMVLNLCQGTESR